MSDLPQEIAYEQTSSVTRLLFEDYIAHVQVHTCRVCNSTVQTCNIYARYKHDRKYHLSPVDRIEPGYRIGTSVLRPRSVPVCANCLDLVVENAEREAVAREQLSRTITGNSNLLPSEKPTKSKPVYTLDDL